MNELTFICFRFEEKNQTFEQLDLQLRKLHASTEALSEFRKSLAQSTGSLSKSLGTVHILRNHC